MKQTKKRKPHKAAVMMRELREKRELSQESFAEMVATHKVRCSQVMICQLESGERQRPNLLVAARIAEITKQLGKRVPMDAWI